MTFSTPEKEHNYKLFPIEEIKEYADTLLQVADKNGNSTYPLNNSTKNFEYNEARYLTTGFSYRHKLEDLESLLIDSTLKENCITESEIETLEDLHEQLNCEDDQICGHVFVSGELVYVCKDCAIDPTCCLCEPCFLKSEHRFHNHTFHVSHGSGGCCDCGDLEAWTQDNACDIHKAKGRKQQEAMEDSNSSETVSDALRKIEVVYNASMRAKVKPFFKEIFEYIIEILATTKQMHKRRYSTYNRKTMQDLLYEFDHDIIDSRDDPDFIEEIEVYLRDLGWVYPKWLDNVIESDEKTAFMMYNNERHNYDEVTERLKEVNTTHIPRNDDSSRTQRIHAVDQEGTTSIAVIIDTIGRVPIKYSNIQNSDDRVKVAASMQMPHDASKAKKCLPDIQLLHCKNEPGSRKEFFKSLYTAYQQDQFGPEGAKCVEDMSGINFYMRGMHERIFHRPMYVLKVIETPITVLAHQEVAIQLVHLLIKLTSDAPSASPVYRDAISELVLEYAKELFELDIYIWKAAAQAVSNLIWQACYRKLSLRTELGCIYAKYYKNSLMDFYDDDHEETCTVLNLGVQVCTTPSIAYAMIEKENAAFKIVRCLRDIMNQKPVPVQTLLDLKMGTRNNSSNRVKQQSSMLLGTPDELKSKLVAEYDFIDDSNLFVDRNMDKEIFKLADDRTNLTNFAAKLKIYAEMELICHGRKDKIGTPMGMDFSPPGTKPQKSKTQQMLEELDNYKFYGYTVAKSMKRVGNNFYRQIQYLLACTPEKMNLVFKKKVLLFAVEFFLYNCKLDGLGEYKAKISEHVKYEKEYVRILEHTVWVRDCTTRLLKWIDSDLNLKAKFLDVCRPLFTKYLTKSNIAPQNAPLLNPRYGASLHHNATHFITNLIYNDNANFSIMPILDQGSSKLNIMASRTEKLKRSVHKAIVQPLIRSLVFSRQISKDLWLRHGHGLAYCNELYMKLCPFLTDTDFLALQLCLAISGHGYVEKLYEIKHRSSDDSGTDQFLGFNTNKYSLTEQDKLSQDAYSSTLGCKFNQFLSLCSSEPDSVLDVLRRLRVLNTSETLTGLYKLIIRETRLYSIAILLTIQVLEERFNNKVAKNITPEVHYRRSLVHYFSVSPKKPSELRDYTDLDSTHVKTVTENADDPKYKDLTWEDILNTVTEKETLDNSHAQTGLNEFVVIEKYQLKNDCLYEFNPYSKLYYRTKDRSEAMTYQLKRRNSEKCREDLSTEKFKPFFTCVEKVPQFKNGFSNILLILSSENFTFYNTMLMPLILTYQIPAIFKDLEPLEKLSQSSTKMPAAFHNDKPEAGEDPVTLYDQRELIMEQIRHKKFLMLKKAKASKVQDLDCERYETEVQLRKDNPEITEEQLDDILGPKPKFEEKDIEIGLPYKITAVDESYIMQVFYLLSILLREHCENIDARKVFEKYDLISLLNCMCNHEESNAEIMSEGTNSNCLSENIKSYASWLLKKYYTVTGELPPMNSKTKRSHSIIESEQDAKLAEKLKAKKEKARKARMAIAKKMQKKQDKAKKVIKNFEDNSGKKVEKIVGLEEDEAKALKDQKENENMQDENLSAEDYQKLSGCDFKENIQRPLSTCIICRQESNLDQDVTVINDGQKILVMPIQLNNYNKNILLKNNDLYDISDRNTEPDQFTSNKKINNLIGYKSEISQVFSTCGHVFHYECLDKQSATSRVRTGGQSQCPYCSQTYTTEMPVFSYQKMLKLRTFDKNKFKETSIWKWITNLEKFIYPKKKEEKMTYKLKFTLDMNAEEPEKKKEEPKVEEVDLPDDILDEPPPEPKPEPKKPNLFEQNLKDDEINLAQLERFKVFYKALRDGNQLTGKAREYCDVDKTVVVLLDTLAYTIEQIELAAHNEKRNIAVDLTQRHKLGIGQMAAMIFPIFDQMKLMVGEVKKKEKENDDDMDDDKSEKRRRRRERRRERMRLLENENNDMMDQTDLSDDTMSDTTFSGSDLDASDWDDERNPEAQDNENDETLDSIEEHSNDDNNNNDTANEPEALAENNNNNNDQNQLIQTTENTNDDPPPQGFTIQINDTTTGQITNLGDLGMNEEEMTNFLANVDNVGGDAGLMDLIRTMMGTVENNANRNGEGDDNDVADDRSDDAWVELNQDLQEGAEEVITQLQTEMREIRDTGFENEVPTETTNPPETTEETPQTEPNPTDQPNTNRTTIQRRRFPTIRRGGNRNLGQRRPPIPNRTPRWRGNGVPDGDLDDFAPDPYNIIKLKKAESTKKEIEINVRADQTLNSFANQSRKLARQQLKKIILPQKSDLRQNLEEAFQPAFLCEKIYVSFIRSFFTVACITKNEAEFEETKFVLNLSSSIKSLVNLYLLAAVTQFFAVSQIMLEGKDTQEQFKNTHNNDDQEIKALLSTFSKDEINQLKEVYLAISNQSDQKTPDEIPNSVVVFAIETIGIFLRKVIILLACINRMPYFKITGKDQNECNIDELSGLVGRKFTSQSILQMMGYCGLKYESILGIFDCNGTSSLMKFIRQWKIDFDESLKNDDSGDKNEMGDSLENLTVAVNNNHQPKFKLDLQAIQYELNFKKKILISLPENFRDLSRMAQEFVCPNLSKQLASQTTGGDLSSNANRSLAVQVKNNTQRKIVMCLLCGELMCMKGNCCQEECDVQQKRDSGKIETKKKFLGPVYRHAACHNNFILILCFNKNKILTGTIDPLRSDDNSFFTSRYATDSETLWPIPTPYIDKFGEFDMGLERGCPLTFNAKYYEYIQELFLSGELISVFKTARFTNRNGRTHAEKIDYEI